MHDTSRGWVTPLLMAVALAAPAVARASGDGRSGSRARVASTRPRGAAPHTATTAQERRPADRRPHTPPIAPAGSPRYGVGYLRGGVSYPAASISDSEEASAPEPSSGWLELDLTPTDAQVYVDWDYAGEVSDFDIPGGRAIEPGPHRVEIRAASYQTAIFDVRLLPDQPVTYREDLHPERTSEPPREATGQTTLYVIAGCYMGNVPPHAALAPGCDAGQLKAITR